MHGLRQELRQLRTRSALGSIASGLPPVGMNQFSEAVQCLDGAPPGIAMAALRTWLSAWSTPARQQHEPGPCPFGCAPPATGEMRHMATCTSLWDATQRAVGAPPMRIAEYIAAVPTARIPRRRSAGTTFGLITNAVAVEAYHRRPDALAATLPEARRLAHQMATEATKHLVPLRLRPRRRAA